MDGIISPTSIRNEQNKIQKEYFCWSFHATQKVLNAYREFLKCEDNLTCQKVQFEKLKSAVL
jgi:hypothetical protein